MVMSDPIADFLTRIRNANMQMHEKVEIPASKTKVHLAEILKNEGFIKDYEVVDDNVQGKIVVSLKYGPNRERVITGLRESPSQVSVVIARATMCQRFLVVSVSPSSPPLRGS